MKFEIETASGTDKMLDLVDLFFQHHSNVSTTAL
jgi:hypothetical protein